MWDMNFNRRVVFGGGRIHDCAALVKEFHINKVFILTYSLHAYGLDGLKKDLADNGIEFVLYDGIKTEPDLDSIDNGTDLFRSTGCEGIIAMGGGSVLDSAKAIAMLSTNGGKVEEYQMGMKTIDKPCVPKILIPTTSGTGSEASKVSVVYNPHNGLKKSLYSPYMIGDVVILDPEIVTRLPAGITAATGMDALSHAIESYVSLDANDVTEMYSLKALELIQCSFVKAVKDGGDIKARSDMMLASYFAGCAVYAGIGVAHIIAQPLGGMFHIPHGDACSIFIPLAMEANLDFSLRKYRRIAEVLGVADHSMDDRTVALSGIQKVKDIRGEINAPTSLSAFINANNFDIDEAIRAIVGATGHIKCNPRPVDSALLAGIIEQSF
jgi:alcohol dehydrogenase class IV